MESTLGGDQTFYFNFFISVKLYIGGDILNCVSPNVYGKFGLEPPIRQRVC